MSCNNALATAGMRGAVIFYKNDTLKEGNSEDSFVKYIKKPSLNPH